MSSDPDDMPEAVENAFVLVAPPQRIFSERPPLGTPSCPHCLHNDPRWCNLAMDKLTPTGVWVQLVRHRSGDPAYPTCPKFSLREVATT